MIFLDEEDISEELLVGLNIPLVSTITLEGEIIQDRLVEFFLYVGE